MLRRSFVMAMGALPASAWAQTAQTQQTPPPVPPGVLAIEQSQIHPYEPENALEAAFINAGNDPQWRAVFRRGLLESHLVLPLTTSAEDSPVRQVRVPQRARDGSLQYFTGRAVYTSIARAVDVFGPETPRIVMIGRAALMRFLQSNVIINAGLAPMLTLEPEDVARYLATPGESSAGPTQ